MSADAPIEFLQCPIHDSRHQDIYSVHDGIVVSWDEVRRILGHDFTYAPEDRATLVAELLRAGAPRWVEYARLLMDTSGWCLIKLSH